MISQGKFDRAYSSLNTAAKKVYDAVPIVECWSIQQVIGELSRRGMQLDYRVIQGSLGKLQDLGLVRQPAKNEFRREGLRLADPKEPHIEEYEEAEDTMSKNESVIKKEVTTAIAAAFSNVKAVPAKAKVEPGALDVLGTLAVRAANLSDMLTKLSSDISDAAIEFQIRAESGNSAAARIAELEAKLLEAEADRQKLRKFQEAFSALSA